MYCNVCKINKDVNEFSPSQQILNTSRCKDCLKLYRKQYRKNNKEKILNKARLYREVNIYKIRKYSNEHAKERYQKNKDNELKRSKNYYKNHKNEKLIYRENTKNNKKEYDKIYYKNNKKELIEYQQEYKLILENKEKINKRKNQREKERRISDPAFKLRKNISRNINAYLKKNNSSKKGNSILKFLPYTIKELKEYLEKQFEPWMTWENQGRYNSKTWNDNDPTTWTWQLDHIIPQSDLLYINMEDYNFKKCWALENLRPLSAKINLLDGVNRIRHKK